MTAMPAMLYLSMVVSTAAVTCSEHGNKCSNSPGELTGTETDCGADQFCVRLVSLYDTYQCVSQFCSPNPIQQNHAGGTYSFQAQAPPSCCRHPIDETHRGAVNGRYVLYDSNPGELQLSEVVAFIEQYDDAAEDYTECPCYCKWVNDAQSQMGATATAPSANRRRIWWSSPGSGNQVAVDAQASCGLDNYPEDSYTDVQWMLLGLRAPTTTPNPATCSEGSRHRRRRSDCSSGGSNSGGNDGGSDDLVYLPDDNTTDPDGLVFVNKGYRYLMGISWICGVCVILSLQLSQ